MGPQFLLVYDFLKERRALSPDDLEDDLVGGRTPQAI
jgi:hypothetical protein